MFYPKDLSTSELLSLTLREKKGEELLAHFGSLRNMETATEEDLKNAGIGQHSSRQLLSIIELVHRYLTESIRVEVIRSPRDVVESIGQEMQLLQHEEFRALFLNTKNHVLAVQTISIGTLNASLVHPRELFKPAILRSAAAVIVCHNHPSGDTEPSSEDIALTRRLKEAGDIVGIELLDHIIIGTDGKFTSLKERGHL